MDDCELKLFANDVRCDIVRMVNNSKSGHCGGSLGMADVFSVLYNEVLNHNPKKPEWSKRDFVFLSNGHICPVLYSVLARLGYFSVDELMTFRKINSRLQGHPHNGAVVGVENSGGPLGQGISQAVGLGASLKRDKKKNKVFCFMGDGELEEGQCWEAFLFASYEGLDNLIVIVDRNHVQIEGRTGDISSIGDVSRKISAFGFKTIEFDGNNIMAIRHALREGMKIKGSLVCLIANTVSGKGVSFMESDYRWHGKAPNDDETKVALNELLRIREKIKRGDL